jgi:predicted transcriptional regulator
MSALELELESLRDFVRQRQQSNTDAQTLEDYICLWRAAQERDETVAAICDGLSDLEQGRVRPAEDVMQGLKTA